VEEPTIEAEGARDPPSSQQGGAGGEEAEPVSVMLTERWQILAGAFETILNETPGRDLAGTAETPERCARAWLELTAGYDVDVTELLKTFDADGYDQMIVVSPIPVTSLCEHHLLPFVGQAHVVYVPTGRIVGLSKIPRVVEAFARRLQVQERLTNQVADAIEKHLDPLGVMVVVDAEHSCATLRGVRKPGLRMKTSAVRGLLKEDEKARAEALALIGY
jgi:GTP cyclohydrolase I